MPPELGQRHGVVLKVGKRKRWSRLPNLEDGVNMGLGAGSSAPVGRRDRHLRSRPRSGCAAHSLGDKRPNRLCAGNHWPADQPIGPDENRARRAFVVIDGGYLTVLLNQYLTQTVLAVLA